MSVKAEIIDDEDRWRAERKPGSIYFRRRSGDDANMWFFCPCGCGDRRGINISAVETERSPRPWSWNGSMDHITLLPSLDCQVGDGAGGFRSHWHGFLRNGLWEQA